jgi:hypothetical protein
VKHQGDLGAHLFGSSSAVREKAPEQNPLPVLKHVEHLERRVTVLEVPA